MANFGPDFTASDTMTSDLVAEVRSLVQGGSREAFNVLETEFASVNDTFAVKYPLAGLQMGHTLEIDWTEYTVVDLNTAGRTITVMPMVPGTDVIHEVGAVVRMKPRFTVARIIREINNELKSLSAAGLLRPVRVAGNPEGGIALPDGALALLDAWSNEDSPRKLPAQFYQISEGATSPVLIGPPTLGWATVGCVLGELSTVNDQLVAATTGLPPMSLDLLPLGAALRLLAQSEAQRNIADSQGDTRRAEEVPPGGPTTAMRNWAALRQSRLAEEVARFQQRYGYVLYPGVF